ncbi:MAG TPA: transketolase [Acholeplasma sp.]|nr:transketolase [Acholeplasma sp.]
MANKKIDNLAIENLRVLAMEAINEAKSGHPGIALGAAPILHNLYRYHLKVDPKNSNWFNRDRFVMSAGHGSSILYATLALAGYNISLEDLKNFRQLGTPTPGHPEVGITDGVDVSTGPLGQGIGMAVGLALAESHLASVFNKEDLSIVDHYTYCLCGDGDLQEGVALEALSFAGHNNLNKLIIIFDSNDIQLDGPTKDIVSFDFKEYMESLGFAYYLVKNGENLEELDKALEKAKVSDKPNFIEVKTKIGHGSSLEGQNKVHGSPLPSEEVASFRSKLGGDAFTVLKKVKDSYQKREEVGKIRYLSWEEDLKAYSKKYPEEYKNFKKALNKEYKVDFSKLPLYEDKVAATRSLNQDVMNEIYLQLPTLFGGAADLASSTKACLNSSFYSKDNKEGANIRFGVREHAMGAITNGISLHSGLIGFASTFFVFSDYLKPAIRLASLMGNQVFYIFSHDSLAVGEDGPTHQPIEQLTMLRSIPNLNVFRPADGNELIACWEKALSDKNRPSVFVLTRQNVPTVTKSKHLKDALKGGYILAKEKSKLDGIIVTSGSECKLALDVKDELLKEGIDIRVCSIPSVNVFLSRDEKYINKVIPDSKNIMALELSEAMHLALFINRTGVLYNVNKFGTSGKPQAVLKAYGFSVEDIKLKFMEMYNKNK